MSSEKKLNLALLPFDILSLIIPHIEILDIAHLSLVSKDFYRCFTDDELCRLALKKLVPFAPESQVPHPSKADFNKLVTRCVRWASKKPSRIELISTAKGTASGDPGAWGLCGDFLIYQSPCLAKDKSDGSVTSSQLVIHDLRNRRADVNVALGSLDEGFRLKESDERSKWKIWIPRTPTMGDSFICGGLTRPSNILVSTPFCAPPRPRGVDIKLPASGAGRNNLEIAPSQMLAVISLEDKSFGKVVCHWKSEEEIKFLALNNHYVAYVTSQHPKKYHIASLPPSTSPTTHWRSEDVPYIVKVYAFKEREISSFGADVSGKYLFVGFGYKHHCFQIIDVSNGACLRKIVLATPVLEEYVSLRLVQPNYEFLHPVERSTRNGELIVDTELVCNYEETQRRAPNVERPLTMALWKISVHFSGPSLVEDVKVETSFVGANPSRIVASPPAEAPSPSIEEQSKCLSVACAHAAQKRNSSWWKDYSNLSTLISTLYASEPEDEVVENGGPAADGDSNPILAENPKWLRPVSSVHIPTAARADLAPTFRVRWPSESSSKHRESGHEPVKIPAPTMDNCPLHIGPGWMVFAKNKSAQGTTMNFLGRLMNCRLDELVVVHFD